MIPALARSLLALTVTVVVTACSAPSEPHGSPEPDPDCFPNHSGVCEGPPLSAAEFREALRLFFEVAARDTTGGADLDLSGPWHPVPHLSDPHNGGTP